MTKEEFQEWANKLKAGDGSFIIFLLTVYGKKCEQYLIKKHHCPADEAEDILMEIVMEIREKILQGKLKSLDNPGGFLLKACERTYWNRVKQRRNHKSKQNEVLFYFYQNRYDEGQLTKLMESELRAEIALEKQKKVDLILKALNTLKRKCQQILRLSIVENLPMKDIATTMGLANKDVAKATKHRCFKKWREKIDYYSKKKN